MNKLGFYIENTTVAWLRQALKQVKPPTILIHAQDKSLLHDIRAGISPDSFIVGRIYKESGQQGAWLDSGDPARFGREFAQEIIDLNHPYGFAKEKVNGRLLIDAWMSLNETLAGPASSGGAPSEQFKRRAEAYDIFQEAFRARLADDGLEAVAFNFAAGNFSQPEHYTDWFPRTLQSYTYLGFHEYGWPSLQRQPSGALLYRTCMEGICKKHGPRYKVIITEAGLTMAYGRAGDDVGWLNTKHTLTEAEYWDSLQWYNGELVRDKYVLGCCLFEVGHNGARWETFRHLGKDNDGKAIMLMDRIVGLKGADFGIEQETADPCLEGGNGDNGGNGGNGDVRGLRERTTAVLAELRADVTAVAHLPEQIASLQDLDTVLLTPAQDAVAAGDLARNLRSRINQLRRRIAALQAAGTHDPDELTGWATRADAADATLAGIEETVEGMADIGAQVAALSDKLPDAAAQEPQFQPLKDSLQPLLDEVEAISASIPDVETLPSGCIDVRGDLPVHPDPGNRYAMRSRAAIKKIIIHHTVTTSQAPAELLAQGQIRRGLPGITYHFLVHGDGASFWTQSLETATAQTKTAWANEQGVGVALAGNFTDVVPAAAQLEAAAGIIVWLIDALKLRREDVLGRNEIENVGSPGAQWRTGAGYKEALLAKVKAKMQG